MALADETVKVRADVRRAYELRTAFADYPRFMALVDRLMAAVCYSQGRPGRAGTQKPAAAWEIADKPAVLRRAYLVAPRARHAERDLASRADPVQLATPRHTKHPRRAPPCCAP